MSLKNKLAIFDLDGTLDNDEQVEAVALIQKM